MKPRKTPPTRGLVAVVWHGLLCFFILVNGLIVDGHREPDAIGMGGFLAAFRATAETSHTNRQLAAALGCCGDFDIEIHQKANFITTYGNALPNLTLVSPRHSDCDPTRMIFLSLIHPVNNLREGGTHELV